MRLHRLIQWGCFSLSVGLGCFWLIYHQLDNQANVTIQHHASQGAPQIGRTFTLTDQHGMKRLTSEFHGKYQLLYFGYSFCPDICPLGLQNISGALTILGRNIDDIVPIFVTVDPERDTVKNLKIYASNFHPKFMMLTGTPQEVAPVLKSYKVYAAKAKPDGTMADYLMDHSTLIYLLDRKGSFLKSFPHTMPSEELAKAIMAILMAEKIKP